MVGAAVVLSLTSLVALWSATHDDAHPEQRAATTTVPANRGVSAVTESTTSTSAPQPAPPGTFAVAEGTGHVVGTGPLRTYTVEVETATGVEVEEFAAVVEDTLGDPRSWIADGSVSLQRVPSGGSARIVLATPGTTDSLCAPLRTNGIYSCGQGSTATVNLDRWQTGIDEWPGPLEEYRHYVINHEFGHVLGHGHVPCPAPGQFAPVMMQQSKGLDGCVPNGWPHP